MNFKKSINIISMTLIMAATLIATSCGKGFNEKALNGSWEDDMGTVLTFNTKDKSASLTVYEQTATGNYEISTWSKMLVTITKYAEGEEDFTEAYSGQADIPLATLFFKDGILKMGNFFEATIDFTGGSGTSLEDLSGDWVFEEEGAKLLASFDAASGTFAFKEYFFLSDEEKEDFMNYYGMLPADDGLIMEMAGTYRTEPFTNIYVALTLDGQTIAQDGELVMADDRKSISINGQTFTKQGKAKKNTEAEEISDELTPELPSDDSVLDLSDLENIDWEALGIDESMLEELNLNDLTPAEDDAE